MERAGFRDSFREVRPDAIAEPGFTWTSGHPGISPWDVFDRIDFVWAAGSSETLSSRVVGDDDPMSDVVVEPWPSDHRAVVSTFDVTPADAPAFVSPLDVRVPIGRPVSGAFHSAPAPDRVLGVWAQDDDPAVDPPLVSSAVGDGRDRRRRSTSRPMRSRRARTRSRWSTRTARSGSERVRGRRSVGPRDHHRGEDPVRGRRADHGVVDERAGQPLRLARPPRGGRHARPPAASGSGATSTRGSSDRRGSRRRRPGTGRSHRAGTA